MCIRDSTHTSQSSVRATPAADSFASETTQEQLADMEAAVANVRTAEHSAAKAQKEAELLRHRIASLEAEREEVCVFAVCV